MYKVITTKEGVTRRNFVRFDRAFWAFGPAIHGFQFCRPFISVDGTHLYGKYTGCPLIATSFDGDNRLLSPAFALVEKENIDTWTWEVSDVHHLESATVVSSSKEGMYFPPHRHRFCIRHIIANLKKRYNVKDLNKMVWRCARAETVAQYDHEMQILEEACPGAKAELTEDLSPEQWALAYDGNMSFGKLTTNSSESVNSLLKRRLSLPVSGPSIGDILSDECMAGEHRVNIMLKECTCRSFQIYQVPCVHAIAVCGAIHYDIHQMTSAYYYASTNARVYERPFDVPTRRSIWGLLDDT
ncbi:hypothetical protein H6P81_006071 [Aristolochia fimbriata]|uniref:SWIM-type domain-containing protein n=1 Tax=Aristolochia fimbriata TaxID=158543 RepID=A0AAV7F073_ARIFI|nr:hypothetical protein H6P81_006071 [Aristolochia fimbriata]